jgi:hypothetical protein
MANLPERQKRELAQSFAARREQLARETRKDIATFREAVEKKASRNGGKK